MRGIDLFAIIAIVVVCIIFLVARLMRREESRENDDAGQAQAQASTFSDAGCDGSGDVSKEEPECLETVSEPARPFGKCVAELPFGDENQLVALGPDIVLMKPERKMGSPLPRISGRTVDSMQVVCSQTFKKAFTLMVHEMKPHQFRVSCFEISEGKNRSVDMKHLFVHKSDKARIAHVFLTPDHKIGQVALIDRDGIQMEIFSIETNTVDVVDFDQPVIADHNSSSDGSFFTYDGKTLSRWVIGENAELKSTHDMEAPFGLEKSFFRQGRTCTYAQFPPVLCTSRCAIFTDSGKQVVLEGIESAIANRFFTTADALWQYSNGEFSSISCEPLEPVLYMDDSDINELEGFAVFKSKTGDSVLIYRVYIDQLEMKLISGIKGRVLDCSFDWKEMALYIFSTEQTLKCLIDVDDFEPVGKAPCS